jgi:hypothetical protein
LFVDFWPKKNGRLKKEVERKIEVKPKEIEEKRKKMKYQRKYIHTEMMEYDFSQQIRAEKAVRSSL